MYGRVNEKFQVLMLLAFLVWLTQLSNIGVQSLEMIDADPVNYLVSVHTIQAYFEQALGVNPYQDIQTLAWLTIPEQKLLEVTAGKDFFEGLNELTQVQQKFS
jgi:hypothetical protein